MTKICKHLWGYLSVFAWVLLKNKWVNKISHYNYVSAEDLEIFNWFYSFQISQEELNMPPGAGENWSNIDGDTRRAWVWPATDLCLQQHHIFHSYAVLVSIFKPNLLFYPKLKAFLFSWFTSGWIFLFSSEMFHVSFTLKRVSVFRMGNIKKQVNVSLSPRIPRTRQSPPSLEDAAGAFFFEQSWVDGQQISVWERGAAACLWAIK